MRRRDTQTGYQQEYNCNICVLYRNFIAVLAITLPPLFHLKCEPTRFRGVRDVFLYNICVVISDYCKIKGELHKVVLLPGYDEVNYSSSA